MKDRCDICIATRYCTIKRTYAGIECPSYERMSVEDIAEDVAEGIAYLNRRRKDLAELKETVKRMEDVAMNTMLFIKKLPDGDEIIDRIEKRTKVKQ